MRVQVDEAGRHDDTGRFHAVGIGSIEPGHGLDPPVLHHDVARTLAPFDRIDEPDAAQVEIGHLAAPARR